jgi:type II secretory ATPase GspE/PulE/Tfp pilus assembly ATPase PilB-like protein
MIMEYSMPDILLTAFDYGGYISPVKLVIFVLFFIGWIPIVKWVFHDTKAVGANSNLWTIVLIAAGFIAAVVWILVPMYFIGLVFYVIAVGASTFSYVLHRDSRVSEYDKILSADGIKNLLQSSKKQTEKLQSFVFVTANRNVVPVPETRTPEFGGYQAAFDLVNDATYRRAVTVLITPSADIFNIIYSVDGAALKQPDVVKDKMDLCINFLKEIAGLDVNEKRKPQKGIFKVRKNKDDIEWEMITSGSTVGEQAKLVLKTQVEVSTIDQLGFTQQQFNEIKSITSDDQGVILISGPPKSGTTTTFYACMRKHDPFIFGVTTLETDIISTLENVVQNHYSLSDSGMASFSEKLMAMIRMGPDVVGVGVCEDAETAKVCAEAAMDGKLIYLVMNTDNSVQAMAKWMKYIGDRALAVNSLIGISNQRILRRLCDQCKEAYEPNKEILRKFNIPAEKAKVLYRAGKVIYDKHGKPSTCENCQGTGFYGRICIFETIKFDDQLKGYVITAKSIAEIGTAFRKAKMSVPPLEKQKCCTYRNRP